MNGLRERNFSPNLFRGRDHELAVLPSLINRITPIPLKTIADTTNRRSVNPRRRFRSGGSNDVLGSGNTATKVPGVSTHASKGRLYAPCPKEVR